MKSQHFGEKNNIIAPRQGDVGYDLVAKSFKFKGLDELGRPIEMDKPDGLWRAIDYIEIDTGVQINPPEGHFAMVVPRSSITKYNLMLKNSAAIIDPSYNGNILLRFAYIPGEFNNLFIIKNIYGVGDKCGQVIFLPYATPNLEYMDFISNSNSKRSDGGFGSTGN